METLKKLENNYDFKMDAEARLSVHNWDDNFTKIKGQVSYKRSLKDFFLYQFEPEYSFKDGKSYGYQEEQSYLIITFNNNKIIRIDPDNYDFDFVFRSLNKKRHLIEKINYTHWVYDSWTSNEFSNYSFSVVFE